MCGSDCPDIDFVYDDSDSYANDIAELYTYTEVPEFQLNLKAFEETMTEFGMTLQWMTASPNTRKTILMKLSDRLELTSKLLRMKAARAVLYIALGCWGEVQSDAEQQEIARKNCILLYRNGIFHIFIELLNLEADKDGKSGRLYTSNCVDCQGSTFINSLMNLFTRVFFLSALYLDIKCAVQTEDLSGRSEYKPILTLKRMFARFAVTTLPIYIMKDWKLVLCKICIFGRGGNRYLSKLTKQKWSQEGISTGTRDEGELAVTAYSCTPVVVVFDVLLVQEAGRNFTNFVTFSSLGWFEFFKVILWMDETKQREGSRIFRDCGLNELNVEHKPILALPWSTKVREKDIDIFLNNTRMKFVGYHLSNDRESLAGLPQPIHEGISVLKQHVYKSLAEIQIKREDEILQHPLSKGNEEIQQTHAELLYQAMLPSLPQHMIALLKILLATAPTSKAKTDSINIMTDVLPDGMPITVVQSMRLGVDVNRHKEIIVKAVSAILLLLLKHFKLNHIYQFEFMSQHLVFANCIPLVLKFFNQNVLSYVTAKNAIAILDFPSCVIGDQPDLTTETLEIGVSQPYCWRNLFACINLLRILNKLTKWKNSRIMVTFFLFSSFFLNSFQHYMPYRQECLFSKKKNLDPMKLWASRRKAHMKTAKSKYIKVRNKVNSCWIKYNFVDTRTSIFQPNELPLKGLVTRKQNRTLMEILTEMVDQKPPNLRCFLTTKPCSVLLQPHHKKNFSLGLTQEVKHFHFDVLMMLKE
nr:EOG090X01YQ [Artemia franciscana]